MSSKAYRVLQGLLFTSTLLAASPALAMRMGETTVNDPVDTTTRPTRTIDPYPYPYPTMTAPAPTQTTTAADPTVPSTTDQTTTASTEPTAARVPATYHAGDGLQLDGQSESVK